MSEKRIFLVELHSAGQAVLPHERLIEAESARAAVQHCVSVQRASAADVARLMAAGVKVEQASE